MEKDVKIWYDPEEDYLEVMFSDAPGYMTPTEHDAIMEMVDERGNILGFSIMALSKFLKQHPLEAHLHAKAA
ncbi:MAG TPA: DUF2283 domain-containing protein [Candidatus Kapabacteria bacterium]|nr:DUF2283 domain-containing protein [Candidatus Kapabacteria bacterium]